MFAFKLSWLMLLACFVAMVHCGIRQSKQIKYKELVNLYPEMCSEGPEVYCKNLKTAKYCNNVAECNQYLTRQNLKKLELI